MGYENEMPVIMKTKLSWSACQDIGASYTVDMFGYYWGATYRKVVAIAQPRDLSSNLTGGVDKPLIFLTVESLDDTGYKIYCGFGARAEKLHLNLFSGYYKVDTIGF